MTISFHSCSVWSFYLKIRKVEIVLRIYAIAKNAYLMFDKNHKLNHFNFQNINDLSIYPLQFQNKQ